VNEIALQLGLKVVPGITVSSTDINATISSNISGVTLVSGNTTINIPLVTIDPDDVWSWRLLSNITADINTHSPLFTATLLTSDGPALQLVQQGNVSNVVAEQVTGGRMILDNPGVIVGHRTIQQSRSHIHHHFRSAGFYFRAARWDDHYL
jgi:hypothetical protein